MFDSSFIQVYMSDEMKLIEMRLLFYLNWWNNSSEILQIIPLPIQWKFVSLDEWRRFDELLLNQINHWLYDLLDSLAWRYHELIFVARDERKFPMIIHRTNVLPLVSVLMMIEWKIHRLDFVLSLQKQSE